MTDIPLRAGAAQVEITPQMGVHLSGDIARFRPAERTMDPLYARALVLDRGETALCFLALDVTIVTEPYTRRIRAAVADATGLSPDAVMVHATQTHCAPSLGPIMLDPDFPALPPEFEWVGGALASYSDWAAERAVEAVCRAHAALQPVEVGVGSAAEGRFAFNRRAVTRDGGILMPPPVSRWGPRGPVRIRYIEGPMDPELGVLCVRDSRHGVRAVVANYACHPVHNFPQPAVSADWPGALAQALQQTHGEACVGLVLNGACGNLNPWPPFDPDYREDPVGMGRALATRAEAAIAGMDFRDDVVLDYWREAIPIPLRDLRPDELAWARERLGNPPAPQWLDAAHTGVDPEWMVAASIYSVHLMRQRSPVLDYEIQVLRVGDAAFVGLPGEPFVEGGLRLKLASPTDPTYVVHATTQYVGYLPTQAAFERGGHEVETRYWSKLVPDALDRVVNGALDVLARVYVGNR